MATACAARGRTGLSTVRERGAGSSGAATCKAANPTSSKTPRDPTKIGSASRSTSRRRSRARPPGRPLLSSAVVEPPSRRSSAGATSTWRSTASKTRPSVAQGSGSPVLTSSTTARSSRSGVAPLLRTLDDLRGKRVATLNQTYAFELLETRPLETVLYEGARRSRTSTCKQGRVDAVFPRRPHRRAVRVSSRRVSECLPTPVRGGYVVWHAPRRRGAGGGRGRRRRAPHRLRRAATHPRGVALSGTTRRRAARMHRPSRRARARVRRVVARPAPACAVSPGRRGDRPALARRVFAIAMPLGVLLAAARMGAGRLVQVVATAYVELLRGTPVLLQLYVLYYGLAPILEARTVDGAATLGLGLNYAAVRGGGLPGRSDGGPARTADGSSRQAGPRSMADPAPRDVSRKRCARPCPHGHQRLRLSLLKDSSLVSVLTVVELHPSGMTTSPPSRSGAGSETGSAYCAALYFAMSFPLSRTLATTRSEAGE